MYTYYGNNVEQILAALDREDERLKKIEQEKPKKSVIDIYFSKPRTEDLENVPIGQPNQKKYFPEISKASLGDEIYLVARTEGLVGKKIKIEVRQAVERQITDKDKPIVFKGQDKNGSITITVGKGVKDKDDKGLDYFSKYANANKLENFAWKSLVLTPETDYELEKWKKTIENSKEKKLYLYFHAEVLEEDNSQIIFLNPDKSEGLQNFGNAKGNYFEVFNGSNIITLKEVEDLFGLSLNFRKFRQEVVENINKYAENPIHLDTALRKAHFFAQVGAETLGINPHWIVEGDAAKYSPDNCRALFGERAKNLEKKGLLDIYCSQRPEQIKLFNYLYADENGFGNGNGNESSGDGFKYRGRGLKQITGKDNYESANEMIQEFFPNEYIDLVKFPEKVREPKYAVLTALAFWEKHTIWKTADTIKVSTLENMKKIRRKVNPGLAGLSNCKLYFEKGLKVFNVK